MPRGNPNIPLSVQTPDFATPLVNLRSRQREDAVIQQQQQRQGRLDESTLASQAQTRELRQIQIDQAKQPSAEQVQATVRAGVLDTIALSDMLKQSSSRQAIAPQEAAEILKQAGGLGISIRDKISQLGGDTGTMDRLLKLMVRDPTAGAEFLDKNVIPQMASTLKDDLFRDVEGGQREVKTREFKAGSTQEAARDLVHLEQDGAITPILQDKQGNFFDINNQSIQIPEGAKVLESITLSGTKEGVLGDVEQRALNDQQVAATNFIGAAGDMITLLSETQDANTLAAGAARVFNDLQQNVGAIARAVGADISLSEPGTFSSDFDELGIRSSQTQGLITSLAFQAAAADAGQTGRAVSNRDVQRFIQTIGANNQDPRAFAQNLQDVAGRIDRGFRNSFEVRTQREFGGDLGLSQLPTLGQGEAEQAEFSEGDTATGPNGEKIVFTNGQWVSQ